MTLCQTICFPSSSSRLLLLLPFLFIIDLPIRAQTLRERENEDSRGLQQTDGQNKVIPIEAGKFGQQLVANASIGDQRGQQQVGAASAGYLLADPTDQQLNLTNSVDATLSSILNRIGPDMRPLRDFDYASADITLKVAQRAWLLMHHHAQVAALDRLRFTWPFFEEALLSAGVSSQCHLAARKTMEAGGKLQSWAIQLLTAWGSFPPTGIYEGTYGDIGSFHGCVNVPENPSIGHAHYCTISYRPVLAFRENYELIMRREPLEMLSLFDKPVGLRAQTSDDSRRAGYNDTEQSEQTGGDRPRDAFADLLYNSQYSHYVYYKYGTCFPIQCSPVDVQKLARLLGRRSILITGPVKCHSKYADDYERVPKSASSSSSSSGSTASEQTLQISTRDLNRGIYIWKPHFTEAQLISLLVICLISLFVIILTLVDIVLNRVPSLYRAVSLNQYESSPSGVKYGEANESDAQDTAEVRSALLNGNASPVDPDMNNNFNLRELNSLDCSKAQTERIKNRAISEQDRATEAKCEIMIEPAVEEQQEGGSRCTNEAIKVDCRQAKGNASKRNQISLFMEIVDDYSIINNVRQFFQVSETQLKNDILCINGIKCITMSWIILAHTMQYNDWSAFARIREVETHLQSLINQPLFNASYLVDTFFFISGLLTSFSSFRAKKGTQTLASNKDINDNTSRALLFEQFSSTSYLIGRYLRLTPQILFVSLLFILLPLLSRSGGPHWYTVTGEYSENCSQNWWVNLLHIQAFYRSNEMCNFVSWWISVDMFYHLFALALILTILSRGHRAGLISCAILALGHGIIQAARHYHLKLPPNLLSTIPQTGAMWSKMTLEFFWTPQAHAFPFIMGFYIGYLMARRKANLIAQLTTKRSLVGWTLTGCLLVLVSYSTYFWVIGRWHYDRLVSTIFYLICPIIWSACLGWTIVACHLGFGGWINRLLSCKLFIILGKASYIVYLSHFLVLFTFFGSQNLLLEPTQLVMLYVILGNICLSMLFGSLLCIVFEMPWLKTQKRLMKFVR